MRPDGPKTWLLDGRHSGASWWSAPGPGNANTVTARDPAGLRLTLRPDGPLALRRSVATIGGLVLPQGMAFDEDKILHLLVPQKNVVKRFQPAQHMDDECAVGRLEWFEALPGSIGGRPAIKETADNKEKSEGEWHFNKPRSIGIVGHYLYVANQGELADRAKLQVFDLRMNVLIHFIDARQCSWPRPHHVLRDSEKYSEQWWRPCDLAVHRGVAYILDSRRRVFTHDPRTGQLNLIFEIGDPRAWVQWLRVAVDRCGNLYVLVRERVREDPKLGWRYYLQEYQAKETRKQVTEWKPGASFDNADDVSDRFDRPPILLENLSPQDSHGRDDSEQAPLRFCLPPSLARPCDRRFPEPPAPLHDPLMWCRQGSRNSDCQQGLLFDVTGKKVELNYDDLVEEPVYHPSGTWYSKALDSRITRCQWHRIELELAELPPGTRVRVFTLTDEQELPDEFVQVPRPPSPGDALAAVPISVTQQNWQLAHEIVADLQGVPDDCGPGTSPDLCEFLVQSNEGRYLWLRLDLESGEFETPLVKSVRIHYPRQSWLEFLPAVYSMEETSRRFLERFLATFQTTWEELEQGVKDFASHLDPESVPTDFLAYLAAYLGVQPVGEFNGRQNRRLLEARRTAYTVDGEARRGTVQSIREILAACLANFTQLKPELVEGFPIIVEGFAERRYVELSVEDSARIGGALPVWSRSVVGRLQLDVHAEVGEVRLVSTGDVDSDVFAQHAHRFRVFLPAAWVSTAEYERILRRTLEDEIPAHTAYSLTLIAPPSRIGISSTLGVDTVMGDPSPLPLGCHDDPSAAPSLPPAPRLGEDIILESDAAAPVGGVRFLPPSRMGVDTLIKE